MLTISYVRITLGSRGLTQLFVKLCSCSSVVTSVAEEMVVILDWASKLLHVQTYLHDCTCTGTPNNIHAIIKHQRSTCHDYKYSSCATVTLADQ